MDQHFGCFQFVTIDITAVTVLAHVPCSQRSPGTPELPQWFSLMLYDLDRTPPYPGAPLKCCQGWRVQSKDPPTHPRKRKAIVPVGSVSPCGSKRQDQYHGPGKPNSFPPSVFMAPLRAVYFILLSFFISTCCFQRFSSPSSNEGELGKDILRGEDHWQPF